MPAGVEELEFQSVSSFAARFRANCLELAGRYPDLAKGLQQFHPKLDYAVGTQGDGAVLAMRNFQGTTLVPNPIARAKIAELMAELFPNGRCVDPVLVAGLDQGWLWSACYEILSGPEPAGYRPPLYLIVRDLEPLWIALHLHDWTDMLKDPCVELFVGQDAVRRLGARIMESGRILPPKICLTLDHSLWPSGMTDKSLTDAINRQLDDRLKEATARYAELYGEGFTKELLNRIAKGERIRVLGITTRFSTFLQYSMRDWLGGWRSLGHEVHLLIEQARHEVLSPVAIAETCAKFKPDLVVIIDHYRNEMHGLLGGAGGEGQGKVPLSVMWIQDRLPNIYSKAAGAAQQRRDYVIGYGRTDMVRTYGYPDERFMPARIGVNVKRFGASRLPESELAAFSCDASYVSHASAPADALVKQWLAETSDPNIRRVIDQTFARLRGHYEAGHAITEVELFRGILDGVLKDAGVCLPPASMDDLQFRFFHLVNNALFRHQTLEWLADMDLNLRLYGKGWERHPRFKRYAKGPADNWAQLRAIYQATRINIQVTPFGALHQRLCDGVAAGGFFLMRHCGCDEIAGLYQPLWTWLGQTDIRRDPDLAKSLPEALAPQLQKVEQFFGRRLADMEGCLVPHIRELANDGVLECPVSRWPHYDKVVFRTKNEMQRQVEYFLGHPEERTHIAQEMRQPVVEHLSYEAINRRLLGFIARDLSKACYGGEA